MEIKTLEASIQAITEELLQAANLKSGDILVLGCSTSEIQGDHIGKNSSLEIGQALITTLLEILKPRGIYLAVQGCEHLNRALVIERQAALHYGLDEVCVVPSLKAGGATSVAAFELFDDPIEVEKVQAKAGIDIGDTFIGMHLKRVVVPFRPSIRQIGQAHVTTCYTRPAYIGGPRATYPH